MPYFRVSVTQKLSPEKAKELADGLGLTLEIIPGKLRNMLILNLEDEKRIYLGGNKQDNFVFADIHYCGNCTYTTKKKLLEITKVSRSFWHRKIGAILKFSSFAR